MRTRYIRNTNELRVKHKAEIRASAKTAALHRTNAKKEESAQEHDIGTPVETTGETETETESKNVENAKSLSTQTGQSKTEC